ncbi:Carbohydrate binding module family 20 [Corchorus capsularis]|uniref:Carbohydrate binding module family 20 n=1 Tax=Corchorus capsularis TaxID=210143 RepID=A0A1R3IR59_COCAP|nr:Carbohydrate binding module family 20 [Corchorus capsularis]
METLASSCSKAIIGTNGDKGFSSFKDVSLHRAEICLLPSKKLVRIRFLNSLSAKHSRLQPVLASSSSPPESQACIVVDLGTAEIQPEEESPTKTSHVKFQLQKECSFGEHFFIVGDHPMFGLWDPESAIPLNWTEGHVWAVELDIPVGKTIQFKFLLKDSDGKLLWQPGPDRIFKSWDTEKTIIVLEDWEDAESQKVMEEEQLAIQDGPVMDSETAIVAENLAPAKEELVSDEMPVSDTNSISNLKNESLQVLPEALATGNGTPSQEKPLPIVAENISYQAEDMIANANNGVHGVKRNNYPNDEPLAIPNQNVLLAEDLGNIGGVETIQNPAMADVEVKLVEHEGSPVLVPGLPSSFVTQEPILDEEEKISMNDASVGVNEANYHTLPELDEKQEPEGEPQEEPKEEVTMTVSKDEEEQQDNQHIQKLQLAREEQPALGHYQSNVLQSDVQWGRKTLQKLLNGLRFLV